MSVRELRRKEEGNCQNGSNFKVLKISTILFEKLVETVVRNCGNKKKPRQFFFFHFLDKNVNLIFKKKIDIRQNFMISKNLDQILR